MFSFNWIWCKIACCPAPTTAKISLYTYSTASPTNQWPLSTHTRKSSPAKVVTPNYVEPSAPLYFLSAKKTESCANAHVCTVRL